MTNHSIYWNLLEERLMPSKEYTLLNCFKGRVLCQGRVDWEYMLPQSHNHKYLRVIHKRSGGTTYESYWFTLIYGKRIVMDIVTLKTKNGTGNWKFSGNGDWR